MYVDREGRRGERREGARKDRIFRSSPQLRAVFRSFFRLFFFCLSSFHLFSFSFLPLLPHSTGLQVSKAGLHASNSWPLLHSLTFFPSSSVCLRFIILLHYLHAAWVQHSLLPIFLFNFPGFDRKTGEGPSQMSGDWPTHVYLWCINTPSALLLSSCWKVIFSRNNTRLSYSFGAR